MEELMARRYQIFSVVAFCAAIFLFQPKIIASFPPVEPAPVAPQNGKLRNDFNPFDSNILNHLVIGIDLGRKYSRVGIFRNHFFKIIPDGQGRTAISSYVAFLDPASELPPLLGFEAQHQAIQNAKNTIYDYRYAQTRRPEGKCGTDLV